jgi:hypothetical protein
MKLNKKPLPAIILLFMGTLLLTSPQITHSFQDSLAPSPGEEQAEKIQPGPQSIKEEFAIYVFIAWLWISIVIIVFLLCLKIKEADRLYQLGYFHSPRGKKFVKIK